MRKRSSVIARLLAVVALAAAVVVVYVAVTGTLDDDSNGQSGKAKQQRQEGNQREKEPRTKASTYEVKPGDTLGKISFKTGVPVTEIQRLNPETDPLILQAGEVLKLR